MIKDKVKEIWRWLMSLFIGKSTNNGPAVIHMTSDVKPASELNSSDVYQTSSLNSLSYFATADVFSGVAIRGDNFYPGLSTHYYVDVDLGVDFGTRMTAGGTGKRFIYFIEERSVGTGVTNLAYQSYTLKNNSGTHWNGLSGYNSTCRFYDINKADEQVYPNANSRYLRFVTTSLANANIHVIVTNTFTDGTHFVETNAYESITISNGGIFFDDKNISTIGYVVSPAANSDDYQFTLGSNTFQILNSSPTQDAGISISASPGQPAIISNGSKVLFSSASPVVRPFTKLRTFSLPDKGLTCTSGTKYKTIFEYVTADFVSVTLNHSIGEDFDDSFVLYKNGPVINFYHQYYTYYTSGTNYLFILDIGVEFIGDVVRLVGVLSGNYPNVTIYTEPIEFTLLYQ